MTDLKLEIPVVNLNGSSPTRMVATISEALKAVRHAYEAVAETAPHPRDWQTTTNHAARFKLAIAQHRARLSRIDAVLDELEAIGIDGRPTGAQDAVDAVGKDPQFFESPQAFLDHHRDGQK